MNSKLNCDPIYYANCRNAFTLCQDCVAGKGKKDLYYDPVEDIGPHPRSDWRQERYKKQSILRKAKQTESSVQSKIVTKTLRSGASLGDGDLLILGTIRQEVKRRGARQSWNLTLEEYKKGLKQGIQIWTVEIQHPETGLPMTIHCLEDSLLSELLANYKENVLTDRTN